MRFIPTRRCQYRAKTRIQNADIVDWAAAMKPASTHILPAHTHVTIDHVMPREKRCGALDSCFGIHHTRNYNSLSDIYGHLHENVHFGSSHYCVQPLLLCLFILVCGSGATLVHQPHCETRTCAVFMYSCNGLKHANKMHSESVLYFQFIKIHV